MYDIFKNQQLFYQGHALKISALAVHPTLPLVATGEVKKEPQVHIWNAETLETVAVLPTSHKGGVMHLAFSSDGTHLVSIGLEESFSLQIFFWSKQRVVAFRNTGQKPIFGVKFNPYNSEQFVTIGYEHMCLWRISGVHLTCSAYKNLKHLQKPEKNVSITDQSDVLNQTTPESTILLCVDFLSYPLGVSMQADPVMGSNTGSVSLFQQGKYSVVIPQAHNGAINCIRITDQLTGYVHIITGGEDGWLKVWDSRFRLVQKLNMKNDKILGDLAQLRNPHCFGI